MVLPLNLAMTAGEMWNCERLPEHVSWMACQFSPYGEGITNIPKALPPGTMVILNDRMPCQGHSAPLAASQLADVVAQFECESVLLDFQRPLEEEPLAVIRAILDALPCPAAVSETYARELDCPVFLSPAPLHLPLAEHLAPWQGREIWLEAALCQETATVTEKGTVFAPRFPPEWLDGGFFDEALCCNYRMEVSEKEIRFTLFDTRESLETKLKKAHSLGVTRAVGLYQELGSKALL